jgi:hypothetical protein
VAGSLADFKYFDDRGLPYLIRIDKSNALRSGTGFVALIQADLSLDYLPRNLEPRYIQARHPNRPINRSIYCQSVNSPLWLGTQKTITLIDYQDNSLQSFEVVNRVFEKKLFRAKLLDTYQTDTTS